MSQIRDFYADKVVFVTGVTGFVGRVFLQQLLRSCPEVANVCCLIRPKKGTAAGDRVKKILDSELFDKLRSEQPDFASKVKIISGDILDDGLGISDSDRQFLQDNIHVVVHLAATVRFDEPLRVAMEMNVLGVRKMIKLSRGFKSLQVFLHVSTAYAHCDRLNIDEVIYPAPVQPQNLIDMLQWLDDDMVKMITPRLLGDKPNTYTYSKHLAENLLVEEGKDLPLAIVRPSVVAAVWKEPIPGWIDVLNMPTAIAIAAGKGILRIFGYGNISQSQVFDYIPVDNVVNMMLAAAFYTAIEGSKQDVSNGGAPKREGISTENNIRIFHMTNSSLNLITLGETNEIGIKCYKDNPLEGCFRVPKTFFVPRNRMSYQICIFVNHIIPAVVADTILRLQGKKPKMQYIYKKLHIALGILEYFSSRQWCWTHRNMDLLKSQLSPADREAFYFDPSDLHWPSYIENWCAGAKKYVLKEKLSGLPAARAHIRRLEMIEAIGSAILLLIIAGLIFTFVLFVMG